LPTVPDVIAERISRYVLDGSDEDLRRLLRISEFLAEPTRAAITRTGIQPGWSAIECGCGPLGALGILADLVGPEGRVVGIDFNEATVARCRSVLDMLGVGHGDVMVADVHDLDPNEAGAPFDIAYCRCFLMHQANPAETLCAVARLVRAGGWIVAQEPLRYPPPLSHPRVPAQERYWELMYQAMEASGIPSYSVETLPRSAESVGLELVHIGGFNRPHLDAASALELHLLTLAASQARIVGSGVASESEMEALRAEMRAAMSENLHWSSSPFFLDVVMRTGT
jgi:SAM-dependent methyltransferase